MKKNVSISVKELKQKYSTEILSVIGNEENIVNSYSTIENPKPKSLIWIGNNMINNVELVEKCPTSIIITEGNVTEFIGFDVTIIVAKKAKLFFITLLQDYFEELASPQIHKSATISDSAILGKNIYIGANCIIEDCIIGDNVVLEGNNHVYKNVEIGNNVILQSGAVIGSRGMSLSRKESGELISFPSLGKVIIHDNVEVGSNSCIDAAVLEKTIIGKGTKINSLTFIGNSVKIGENNYISVSVNINGSVVIGNDNFIGSGSSIRNKIRIGNNNTIGAGAVVVKSISDNNTCFGNPAKISEDSKGIKL